MSFKTREIDDELWVHVKFLWVFKGGLDPNSICLLLMSGEWQNVCTTLFWFLLNTLFKMPILYHCIVIMSQHLVIKIGYQYFVLWLKIGGGYPLSWIWKGSLMRVVFITLPKCWWICMCFWGTICWRFGFQTYLFWGRWCDCFSRHERWCDNVVKWEACTFVVGVHCMAHRCNLVV